MFFQNRTDAGKKLAAALAKYKNQDAIVYALPRGGVVVGVEVAKALYLPLDLVVTRKIGAPNEPEYAIAAVSESGELIANQNEMSQIDESWFQEELKKEIAEAKRRRKTYVGKPIPSPKGKIAILVDDGIATGLTILAAIKELKKYAPKKLVVAVPVSPTDSARKIKLLIDEFICLDVESEYLGSVGAYYSSFPQVEDEEVIKIINSVAATTVKTRENN